MTLSINSAQTKALISILLTVIAGYVLWRNSNLDSVGLLASRTRPLWLFIALAIFALSLGVRALRLSRMYLEESSFVWHFYTVSFGSVMNFLLPARLGEFSIVALVSKRLDLRLREVAVSLLAIRLQETVWTLVIAAVLLITVDSNNLNFMLDSLQSGVSLGVLVIAGGGIGICLAFYIFRKHDLLKKSGDNFRSWQLWGYSALIAALMFALIFAIAKWLNIGDALAITPLVFLAALLVSFFPVNGLANVGGYHLAWALPLMAAGYDSELAVSLAILAHLGVSALVVAAAIFVLTVDILELKGLGPRQNT